VTGWMIFVTDEQDFRPKIRFETMLCFDDRQIITGGNNAAIKDNKVFVARGEDYLLLTGAEREASREEKSRMTKASDKIH
jgi:hypothetical protein